MLILSYQLFLVLGAFDSELPFADSPGEERNQGSAARIVAAASTKVSTEVEHACTRTTVEVAAAIEPGIAGIREARGIRVPSSCATS